MLKTGMASGEGPHRNGLLMTGGEVRMLLPGLGLLGRHGLLLRRFAFRAAFRVSSSIFGALSLAEDGESSGRRAASGEVSPRQERNVAAAASVACSAAHSADDQLQFLDCTSSSSSSSSPQSLGQFLANFLWLFPPRRYGSVLGGSLFHK